MHSPYTDSPQDAFTAAHVASAVVVGTLGFTQRRNLRWGFWPWMLGVVVVALHPVVPEFLRRLQYASDFNLPLRMLQAGLVALLLAALLSKKIRVIGMAMPNALFLFWLGNQLEDFASELAQLHLAAFALVAGVSGASGVFRPGSMGRSWHPERWLFGSAVALSVVVCAFVLRGGIDSSDEWAYTFQAATFAKGHASSVEAPCGHAFQNFWVFDHLGRRFSQYTPGWPLFMAPFFRVRAIWLAGPVAFGVLVLGVSRLARRLVAVEQERVAGWVAGLATCLGATFVINGASRFPHVWVAACFAWSLESISMARTSTLTPKKRLAAAFASGLFAAWIGATRPPDGAMLGIGIVVFAVWTILKREVSWWHLLAAAAGVLLMTVVTLGILRLQLGAWFQTAYPLNERIHPWNKLEYSWPLPHQWKWSLPFATGAYSWWPVSIPISCFGLAVARGPLTRRLWVSLVVSTVSVLAYYSYVTVGRGTDWGYGPRYQLICVVLFACGTGAAFAHLHAHWRISLASRGPATSLLPLAIAGTASVLTLLRLVPLLYPVNYDSIAKLEEINDIARTRNLNNALVMVEPQTGERGPLDYTQNLPLDLYPRQRVLVASLQDRDAEKCLRANFPNRQFFRASGKPVKIEPAR